MGFGIARAGHHKEIRPLSAIKTLWVWAGICCHGHCRNTAGLGTGGILSALGGWPLQGYSAVGHCRDAWWLGTAGCRDAWWLGTAGMLCRLWAEGEDNKTSKSNNPTARVGNKMKTGTPILPQYTPSNPCFVAVSISSSILASGLRGPRFPEIWGFFSVGPNNQDCNILRSVFGPLLMPPHQGNGYKNTRAEFLWHADTIYVSNVFWWLNLIRLYSYSLYKILDPKGRIESYSIMGTIVSPNKTLLM